MCVLHKVTDGILVVNVHLLMAICEKIFMGND